jgi:hypothetical protein
MPSVSETISEDVDKAVCPICGVTVYDPQQGLDLEEGFLPAHEHLLAEWMDEPGTTGAGILGESAGDLPVEGLARAVQKLADILAGREDAELEAALNKIDSMLAAEGQNLRGTLPEWLRDLLGDGGEYTDEGFSWAMGNLVLDVIGNVPGLQQTGMTIVGAMATSNVILWAADPAAAEEEIGRRLDNAARVIADVADRLPAALAKESA